MHQIELQPIEISVMKQFTPLEYDQIVELHIKNNRSIRKRQLEFCTKFKSSLAPAKNTMKKIYKKFTTTTYLG